MKKLIIILLLSMYGGLGYWSSVCFIASIMETMLLNAKLKLFRAGDSHGVELCDT